MRIFIDYIQKNLRLYVADWVRLEGAVILVEDIPVPLTEPDLIWQRAQTLFQSTPFQLQPPREIDLPVGRAYEFEAVSDPNRSSGEYPLSIYLIVRNTRWYSVVFLFTSAAKQAEEQPIVDHMMQSFRINDAATEQATEAAP